MGSPGIPQGFFLFFFFDWIYSPRGLRPIIDFTYFVCTPKRPRCLTHSPETVQCIVDGAPQVLAPPTIQPESGHLWTHLLQAVVVVT